MLTELSISTPTGDSLSLPIPSGSDGYLVTEIEGLDPVPVTMASSPYALLDGEYYHESRREKRNIILHIKLRKNYWSTTIDYRRNRLYSIFVPKQEITLIFNTPQNGNVTISGRVETINATMWTDEPVVIVSIICFNPDFRAINPVTATYAFSTSEYRTINYPGTVLSGVTVAVVDWETSSTSSTNTKFTNKIGNDTTQEMLFAASLGQWDRLSFCTVPGSKHARLTLQNNSVVSALSRLSATSTWLMLGPGLNSFLGTTNVIGSRKYSVSYYPLYGGI